MCWRHDELREGIEQGFQASSEENWTKIVSFGSSQAALTYSEAEHQLLNETAERRFLPGRRGSPTATQRLSGCGGGGGGGGGAAAAAAVVVVVVVSARAAVATVSHDDDDDVHAGR